MSNYDCWQLEKYGSILQEPVVLPDGELFETGIEELNRLAEWIEMQAEQKLINDEKMHDWH
jgi:hypothetical protein